MDRITETYNGAMGNEMKQASRERIHWVCAAVRGDNILDIGCSQGICDILLAREGFRVMGVDADAEAIEFAQNSLSEESENTQKLVRFFTGTVPGFDLKEEKFSTVILTEILEHLIQPKQMIDYACSILKQNGLLIVTVPYGVNPYPDHKRTFYLTNLLDLFIKRFRINSCKFFSTNNGCWIGIVAELSDNPGISEELFHQAVTQGEKNFEILDLARFRIKGTYEDEKKKWASERETLKQKLEASDTKVKKFGTKLEDQYKETIKLKQKYESQIENLKKDNAILKTKLLDGNCELNKNDYKKQEYESQVENLKNDNAILKTRLLDMNYELKKIKNDYIDFQIKNAKNINLLNEKNKADMDELCKNIQKLEEENEELSRQINDLITKN